MGDDRREPYIGEKHKLLRNGYGTYVYENQFFRYEGEWMKGKKHGHGKLVMQDGTFYEGQFINGEISGHGFKYFESSQSKYTGQFLNGEMNGQGCMVYNNGIVYDGQWYRNKRQGFGVLTTKKKCEDEEMSLYDVSDYDEEQPYDQTYHNLSNGDRFEGNWVMDKRQGHGELICADGTRYKGQFMNDRFHGDGMIVHASGIYYNDMWINGFPAIMATTIVMLIEEGPFILPQGQTFTITVECRNDQNEFVPETGRVLQVMAGFRYWKPADGSALFDVIEDVADKPIETPFYAVVPYPLTDQPIYTGVASFLQKKSESKFTMDDDERDDEGSKQDIFVQHIESSDSNDTAGRNIEFADNGRENYDGTSDETLVMMGVKEAGHDPAAEEVAHMLHPVGRKLTIIGRCEWGNLQLAPPPPMYRPFVVMEEELRAKKKTKTSFGTKDYFNLAEDFEDEESGNHEEEEDMLDIEKLEMDEKFDEEVKEDKHSVDGLGKAYSEVASHDAERKSTLTADSLHTSRETIKSKISKTAEEKFARTGEYILIVQDVTNPPFMGQRLKPAYLVLQLVEPELPILKKSSSEEVEDENEDESTFENEYDNSKSPLPV